MKRIILFLLIVYSCDTFAQIKTWQLSLKDSSLKVFYIGVENRVRIENLPAGAVVTLKHGKVQHLRGNEYLCRINANKPDTMVVKKEGKRVFTQIFESTDIRDVKVSVGTVWDSMTYPERILADPRLYVLADGGMLKNYLYVVSFSVTCVKKGVIAATEDIRGDSLPPGIRNVICGMKKGDKIFFDDIRVLCPECRTRSLTSFTLYIN